MALDSRARARCDLFMREASSTRRSTLLSGFSKTLVVTSFVKRKKNIGWYERAFILCNTTERVSRDLHQIPKEVYPMMNLATIFPRRKVTSMRYLSSQLLNF